MFKIRKDEEIEYDFLPDVLEITEKPTSKAGKFVIYLLFLVIVIAVLWSCVFKVDMVVTGRGQIIPEGNLRVLQSFESGTLVELNVTDGEYVREGEVVLKLDTDLKDLDIDNYEGALNKLYLEKEILSELINDNKTILSQEVEEENKYILDFYKSKEDNYDIQILLLQGEIEQSGEVINIQSNTRDKIKNQLDSNIQSQENNKILMETKSPNEEELEKIEGTLKYQKDVMSKNEKLYNEGVLPKSDYITSVEVVRELEKEVEKQKKIVETEKFNYELQEEQLDFEEIGLNSDLEIQTSQINSAKMQLEKVNRNLENLLAERKLLYSTNLIEVENKIFNYNSELEKSNKRMTYSNLTAPISGTIHGLSKNTLGEVIAPNETILTIIPSDQKLIVEMYVLNKDIGVIEENQEVIVKVDTYPFQEFGTLQGEIKHISPNSFMMEGIGYVYKVNVHIKNSDIIKDNIKYDISSGMQVTGEIVIGERRVIQYFLNPIFKALDESIKQY